MILLVHDPQGAMMNDVTGPNSRGQTSKNCSSLSYDDGLNKLPQAATFQSTQPWAKNKAICIILFRPVSQKAWIKVGRSLVGERKGKKQITVNPPPPPPPPPPGNRSPKMEKFSLACEGVNVRRGDIIDKLITGYRRKDRKRSIEMKIMIIKSSTPASRSNVQ
ncbi:hypothetical protein T07_10564 [Trichinella nelsoni]|uniref:Uncharacterized protein n=1 Tax=Trichinella nelsoni TaxID=6336 RepID=A0A0V0SDF6_9BILA|nr:hypothetical protein T07_10564 [Trichinella nelsoni]